MNIKKFNNHRYEYCNKVNVCRHKCTQLFTVI